MLLWKDIIVWLRGPVRVPGRVHEYKVSHSMNEVHRVPHRNWRVRSRGAPVPSGSVIHIMLMSLPGSFHISFLLNSIIFAFSACPWKVTYIWTDTCFIQDFLDKIKLSLAKVTSNWTFINLWGLDGIFPCVVKPNKEKTYFHLSGSGSSNHGVQCEDQNKKKKCSK